MILAGILVILLGISVLVFLEYKENFYKNLIKNNLKDTWNPMNSVTPNDKVG